MIRREVVEELKASLSHRYAEQLAAEQTHLTDDQRAHMCVGFEHGLGWLFKALESVGLKIEGGR